MEIMIGLLALAGEIKGGHVHVTVRGEGGLDSRPLCGQFVATEAEWRSLVRLNDEMASLHKELARETSARIDAVDALDRIAANAEKE